MSQRSRTYAIAVSIVLVVVGAAVAGLLVITSGRASGVDLTSADLAPADAVAYVALNTDLSSSQWLSAFSLAKRLGQKDPQGALRGGASDGGVDWHNDVAPFLGGDAGIYLRGVGASADQFQGAVIVRCKDSARALDAVKSKSGLSFSTLNRNGTAYLKADDGSVFVARLDNHLVAAMDEQSMFAVLDVKAGKAQALSSAAAFRALRDELATNFLAFVYVSPQAAVQSLSNTNQDPFAKAFAQMSGSSALQPMAYELGAKAGSFELQGATPKGDGKVAPPMQQRTSRFASLVPGDSSIFFSTFGLAQSWQQISPDQRRQLDDAIREEGQYQSLDDALTQIGQQIGLQSMEQLIDLFTGEVALSMSFPGNNADSPSFAVLAEVKDQAQAADVFAKIAGGIGATPEVSQQQVGQATLHIYDDDNGNQIAYTLTDGYLAFGSLDAVKAVAGKSGAPLAQQTGYKATIGEVPTGLGTYLYLNLAPLIKLAGSSTDFLQGILSLDALQGFVMNAVTSNSISHFSAVVSVAR